MDLTSTDESAGKNKVERKCSRQTQRVKFHAKATKRFFFRVMDPDRKKLMYYTKTERAVMRRRYRRYWEEKNAQLNLPIAESPVLGKRGTNTRTSNTATVKRATKNAPPPPQEEGHQN